ncbi:XerC/XerD family integrase/recombinase, partial [mine drainage metagenome]
MQALRVALTDTLAYWTVVDDDWRPVPSADAYLRHLRLGADRAEGTTRSYASDLACYLSWCEATGRDLLAGVQALGSFVTMLKTTPVTRAGAGRGQVRSAGRINHVLAAVRELYKHAVAEHTLDASVLTLLYEVGDDRHLPAELRPEGSGTSLSGPTPPRPAHAAHRAPDARAPRRGGGVAADISLLAGSLLDGHLVVLRAARRRGVGAAPLGSAPGPFCCRARLLDA